MPDPQNLPRVAAAVVENNLRYDKEDVTDAVDIAFAAARGDMETVMTLAKKVARRNMAAVESQQLLTANQPGKAEDVVLDFNIEEQKLREVKPAADARKDA